MRVYKGKYLKPIIVEYQYADNDSKAALIKLPVWMEILTLSIQELPF